MESRWLENKRLKIIYVMCFSLYSVIIVFIQFMYNYFSFISDLLREGADSHTCPNVLKQTQTRKEYTHSTYLE